MVTSMASHDRTKRDAPISYRPPERLRGKFRARVDACGLWTNAFITAAAFGRDAPRARRVTGPELQTVARLLAEAARITDRLLRSFEGAKLVRGAEALELMAVFDRAARGRPKERRG